MYHEILHWAGAGWYAGYVEGQTLHVRMIADDEVGFSEASIIAMRRGMTSIAYYFTSENFPGTVENFD